LWGEAYYGYVVCFIEMLDLDVVLRVDVGLMVQVTEQEDLTVAFADGAPINVSTGCSPNQSSRYAISCASAQPAARGRCNRVVGLTTG
jgi:hypothetical protein